MDTARAALSVTSMGGKIYAIGGAGRLAPMSVAERYDPNGGGWRGIPDLPVGLEQFGFASLDGKLYAAGGYAADGNGDPGKEVWRFDEVEGEWVPVAPLPSRRAAFSMVAASGRLYIIGGAGEDAEQMEIYDPEHNAWRSLFAKDVSRRGASVLSIGNKIYVIAGGAASTPSGRVDIFDIESETWSQGEALAPARTGQASAVFQGKIHVMGGRTGGRGETLKDHWIYDPSENHWTRGDDLSTPRTGAGAATSGASLYVIGGGSGGGFYASFTAMNSVEVLRNLPDF